MYTTFTCVYTSTESECKSLTENWSSNFIFTVLKKATTTETVTETEKWQNGNRNENWKFFEKLKRNWNWKIYTDNLTKNKTEK